MQKIPSLFKRDYEGTRLVYDEVVEGCEWVIQGEGVATVKWDGTACLMRDGILYKRYDRKQGKSARPGWEPAEDTANEHTGHWPGWLPVNESPEDKWHRAALSAYITANSAPPPDGTYELVGPKVQGNPYHLTEHQLWRHGSEVIADDPPRDFTRLKEWFASHAVEGIVWHHPDGRLCKIKRRDFGHAWPPKEQP